MGCKAESSWARRALDWRRSSDRPPLIPVIAVRYAVQRGDLFGDLGAPRTLAVLVGALALRRGAHGRLPQWSDGSRLWYRRLATPRSPTAAHAPTLMPLKW